VFNKMHEVLSGLPVLGSGTESVAGLQSKTEGFFSVLAQYDFSVSNPQSVANIQDGIYTYLEVLAAARQKKERKQTGAEMLREWIGWLCYVVLFGENAPTYRYPSHTVKVILRCILMVRICCLLSGLCGSCIYLILSPDWIPDQCCPCGCASCDTLTLPPDVGTLEFNRTLHFNHTRSPEFCNDPAFECNSCLTGYKNPLLKIKNSDSPVAGIIQPLLLSVTTALIPMLTKQIRIVERRVDMADEMRVTLIRVFFLKMFNVGLMFGVSRYVLPRLNVKRLDIALTLLTVARMSV
jgi:hypothetical protein